MKPNVLNAIINGYGNKDQKGLYKIAPYAETVEDQAQQTVDAPIVVVATKPPPTTTTIEQAQHILLVNSRVYCNNVCPIGTVTPSSPISTL